MRTNLTIIAFVTAFGLILFILGNTGNNNIDAGTSSTVGTSANSFYPAETNPNLPHAIVGGTFLDNRDNKVYTWIKIGEQVWMAKNLSYAESGSKCGGTDGKLKDENTENCDKYGRLYNWSTAMAVCPYGWHLPTNEEWDKLTRYVDGNAGTSSPYDSPTAGKHLKAMSGWNSGNKGTDDYGFAALPGGNGDSTVNFHGAGKYGIWWSTSEDESNRAYSREMFYYYEDVHWYLSKKNSLHSVRCIKD